MGIGIFISQHRRDMMDEKYDLKWKTFNEHLVEVFRDLGEEGHFADVTLVSEDQVQTKAHKVVLSACSPVLKTLLVNNPHSHPLLYLRGIKQTELQAILKFMYFGETQIFENRINDFVSVAKDLELKEISEGQDENENDAQENVEQPTSMDDTDIFLTENNDKTNVKAESKVNSDRSVAKARQRSVANDDGNYSCDECEAKFTDRSNLSRHKKSKHEGVTSYS